MIGVDYASVDGNERPDIVKVKTAIGCAFAIIRGSYKTWTDPTAKRDTAAWRAANIPVGVYAFPDMTKGGATPADQIQALARSGAVMDGDIPPTLDVEFPGGIARTGRTRAELLAWILEAVMEMRRVFGCSPMLYTSARVWDGEDADALDADHNDFGTLNPTLAECPLWLARYPFKTGIQAIGDTADERKLVESLPWPPVPKAWGDQGNVWIHQYQGDAIKLNGFSATVDLNRFRMLRHGDTGERVCWLKRRLCLAEGMPGVFDDALDDAVREFQRREGLVSDGVVGPRTFARIAWL